VAVVGAGAAGLACAVTAAQQGHAVTLYEAAPQIGGQLNLARAVPGKQEFDELLRYFRHGVESAGVELCLKQTPSAAQLAQRKFDRVVVATGVRARVPRIEGLGHAKVIDYADLLSGRAQAGRRVAIIGAGGIGFDVAEYLLHDAAAPAEPAHATPTSASELAEFQAEWGVDTAPAAPGGLKAPQVARRAREVTLLQRKPQKPGRTLGLSTGWALRAQLDKRGLRTLSGCSYERIDDAGLHLRVNGEPRVLEVDSVIVCAGQDSENALAEQLQALGVKIDVIGGAQAAAELDALRAIEQGTRVALAM
jgi:2,4-dienoyl-CoA reductase (NADPH2)